MKIELITKEEFNELYTAKKRSITKKIDSIKVQAKTVRGTIELWVNSEFVGTTVGDYDYLTDLINESVEIQKSYFEYDLIIEQEREDLIKKGAKYFSLNDIKSLLIDVIPSYLGSKHTAMTDSEYWNINGKTVRFSDHTRPATSKWNFIHGDNTLESIEGYLTIEMIIDWLTDTIDVMDIDVDMLKRQFDLKK